MAEKILNTRIALKIDTLENWGNSTLPLKKGELALATVAASAGTGLTEPVVMIKVGEDGVKTFKDLEWNVYAKASDVLAACKSEASLKAFVNGVIADAGIATNEAMEALAGRVTTVENDLNAEKTGLKARMTAAETAIAGLDELVGDDKVSDQITAAINALNLADTYAAKVHNHTKAEITDFAHNHEMSEVNGLAAALAGKQDAGDYAAAEHGHEIADVTGLADAIADAKKAGTDAQTYAEGVAGDLATLSGKVGEVPADKTVVQMISDAQSAATYDDTALAGRVTDLEDLVGDEKVSEAIAAAVATEKERAEGIEGDLETRLAAVEGDYLKTADKEALQTQINTIMNNPDAEGAINSINEFTQYVADHGTIADGMRTDINKNKEDIAAEVTRATGVESGLDSRLQAVEAKLTDDGAVKSDIDAALTEAKGYTDTEVQKLADGAVKTNANNIAAIDALVGDTAVATQITNVTNPLAERIEDLEAIDHEHANKAELDKFVDGDKAKLDAAVQTVTAAADSGLKATKTGTDVAIEIDDSITWVFDCGTSAV